MATNLVEWRTHTLARLAAERSELLNSLLGLSEASLSDLPVFDHWSAKDLVAHIARWDGRHNQQIHQLLSGETRENAPRRDTAQLNAALHHQDRTLPLELALAVLLKERAAFLASIGRISDSELHRQRELAGGELISIAALLEQRARHDASHTADIRRWRRQLPRNRPLGPPYLLRAALKASRKAFLALAALIPPRERETRPVCGVWTLKDLLGHLADWELLGVQGVADVARSGQLGELDYEGNIERWNARHAAARQQQPWALIWQDFQDSRPRLVDQLDRLTAEELATPIDSPWSQRTVYEWFLLWLDHEREHAADLRVVLQLEHLPDHLRRHER